MANSRGRPRHPDVLTPAEWQVLEHIRAGRTNPEIAEELGVSVNTVRYHVSNILGKLDLRSREAARGWTGAPRRWAGFAFGAAGLAKVAMVSVALVISSFILGGAISGAGGTAADSGGLATTPQATTAQEGRDELPQREPGAVPSTQVAEERDSNTNDVQAAPTIVPPARAAHTTPMCHRESEQIAETFGAPRIYEAIANASPELVATGSAQWIDVDGCIVHRSWPDLDEFLDRIGMPIWSRPDQVTTQCSISDPLIPAGTRLELLPVGADQRSEPPEHRLVMADGTPLEEPVVAITSCTLTGGELRAIMGGVS